MKLSIGPLEAWKYQFLQNARSPVRDRSCEHTIRRLHFVQLDSGDLSYPRGEPNLRDLPVHGWDHASGRSDFHLANSALRPARGSMWKLSSVESFEIISGSLISVDSVNR